MSKVVRLLASILLALAALMAPAHAAGPDYALPGGFALPWFCGQARRVTWGPVDHWLNYKARGLAFDFSMDPGTPLYAPMSGQAYFLLDERPLETNYGHYIEIVDRSGYWMVRLAHLRDPQSGERSVRAGELIGYSGSSGVPEAHLHLELLVYQDGQWVAPDRQALPRLFGVDATDLVEGALVTNDACKTSFALAGPIALNRPAPRLGEPIELLVPLRNEGLEPLTLQAVQLAVVDPEGRGQIIEATGTWAVPGQGDALIHLYHWPDHAGSWRINRVTCQVDDRAYGLAAEDDFLIGPSALQLSAMDAAPTLRVGEPLTIAIEIENLGAEEITWDTLYAEGRDPEGLPWKATADQSGGLSPWNRGRFVLEAERRPLKTGVWHVERVGYTSGGHSLVFAQQEGVLRVSGPELRVRQLRTFAAPGRFIIFMDVANVGTEPATPDRVEIWGWKPGGDASFCASIDAVPGLPPSQAAYLRFEIPTEGKKGPWKLVEGG
ncbi:MAG: M23 family metallopeptidase, partial [Chloroflexi bacterium]|nr:M23 family metallopeptidase [Chloroflexota bacterium]